MALTPNPSGSSDEILAQFLSGMANGSYVPPATANDASQRPVYQGRGAFTPQNNWTPGGASGPSTHDATKTVAEVYQEFYGWSDADRAAWARQLVDAGLIDKSKQYDFHTLESMWQDAVDTAANFYASGRKVTPKDVVGIFAGPAGAGGASSKASTTTSRYTSVDLTDPTTARALVNDVLANALGRAANDDEVRAFTDVLHRAQAANPTSTTVTSTTDAAGNVAQSSTSSGGLDTAGQQQVVLDQAMKMPDYGAYQAATSYLNALFSAVRSPVG